MPFSAPRATNVAVRPFPRCSRVCAIICRASFVTTTVNGIEGIKALIGQQIGPSEWREVTQEDDQLVRRALGRRPVDPRRRRARQEGEPVRHDVAHGNLTLSMIDGFRLEPDPVDRLQAGRQLRLEQGPLPGAGSRRLAGPRARPRSSRSTRSAAAGGRSSPASPSRSRATRSPLRRRLRRPRHGLSVCSGSLVPSPYTARRASMVRVRVPLCLPTRTILPSRTRTASVSNTSIVHTAARHSGAAQIPGSSAHNPRPARYSNQTHSEKQFHPRARPATPLRSHRPSMPR